ncbi:MAG: carboxymuconolactone decarboxylase family protein [Chloroflexota bacterium]
MKTFHRRMYRNLGDFLTDMRAVMSQRKNIRAMMRGLDPAFRERLFLAVTQVNGCRYCSYFHARQALLHGVTDEEIRGLGDGLLDRCPPQELTALFYAQHWAESDARPDPEARARLLEAYGAETTARIDLALRMIRVGNLTGNLFDYIVFRLSFGLVDVDKPLALRRANS